MGSASGDSGDPPPALVLCGPSGAGKSTLMKLLTSEFRDPPPALVLCGPS